MQPNAGERLDVNELPVQPIQLTTNVFDALLVTGRPIAAGEELYLDYGKKYDRSDYGQ